MVIAELLIISVGLAMDAFAVSIGKGLSLRSIKLRHVLSAGLWFGGFQALMPFIGFLLGTSFEKYVTKIDHWIAFILLGAIGANMIKESFGKDESEADASFGFKTMFVMAVATSIDALAVGISLALLPDIIIFAAVIFIGIPTFLFSAFGVIIGNVFGEKYKSKAELLGGVILILLGLKILLEHLGVL